MKTELTVKMIERLEATGTEYSIGDIEHKGLDASRLGGGREDVGVPVSLAGQEKDRDAQARALPGARARGRADGIA